MVKGRKRQSTDQGTAAPSKGARETRKRRYEKPQVTHLGRVDKLVRGGGGKLYIAAADPGEPFRKPKGLDP